MQFKLLVIPLVTGGVVFLGVAAHPERMKEDVIRARSES